jgi:hypothetical protein
MLVNEHEKSAAFEDEISFLRVGETFYPDEPGIFMGTVSEDFLRFPWGCKW